MIKHAVEKTSEVPIGRTRGFSPLVELLVVISIIGILMSPAAGGAGVLRSGT